MGQIRIVSNIFIFLTLLVIVSIIHSEASNGKIDAISSGDSHTVALTENGTLLAWGNNWYGQCGVTITSNNPLILNPVETPISNVVAIAAGSDLTMALKDDGTVWTFGNNNYGQLGNGSLDIDNHPISVMALGLTNLTAISAGSDFCLALKDDGTVWAWGHNDWGQLGDGNPVELTTNNTSDVVDYYYIDSQSWSLSYTGPIDNITAYLDMLNQSYDSWNKSHQNTTKNYSWAKIPAHNSIPRQVVGLTNIKFIAGNLDSAVAVDTNDTIWAWGHYRLNYSTLNGFSTPTKFGVLKNVVAVSRNGFLTSDGTVWELNFADTKLRDDPQSIPYDLNKVSGLTNVISISNGIDHSVALKNDGTIWGWGQNAYGQLGDGTNKSESSPTRVLGLPNIVNIASGAGHTIAVSKNGTVYGWGSDTSGQLGDGSHGDSIYQDHPVKAAFSLVPSEKMLTAISLAAQELDKNTLSTTSNNTSSAISRDSGILILIAIVLIVGGALYLKLGKKK